ncbi:MAG TPA: hypothetical protein VHQ86_06045, partial [Candidatus Saccharimonadia bacterium]|nr:hypothetical protein [Candidatus Saccharimonadia bacterium]
MNDLRAVFFLRRIYFTQTLPSILLIYGIWLLVGFLAAESRYAFDLRWFWLPYAYFLIRTCLRLAIVYRRTRDQNYITGSATPWHSQIIDTAVSYELDTVDKVSVLTQGPEWSLYDAVFNFYRQTKYGQYLAKQAYYTVAEFQLDRQVPHIIFDSKQSKRYQFKYLYLRSQRLSFEGNFDTFFEVYAPETYQIDSLSFITPEVMEAMLAAKDYDIELTGDKVLLYAPLLGLGELDQLKSLGQKVSAQLNDNLDTYRDDRLTGQQRVKDVSPFGRRLLKSPLKFAPVLVLSGLGTGAILYFAFTYSMRLLFDQLSLIVILTFVGTLWSMFKIVRENHQLEREYQAFLTAKSTAVVTPTQKEA